MDKVHTLLTTYFSEVEIVCYLRDQISTCTSYYSTALKSGHTSTFAEFIGLCTPNNYYFNYWMMLQNWERCFGFDALNVSLFSREHFLNGSLLDDFTAKIDPQLVGALNTNVQNENESLNASGQAWSRAINLAFPNRLLRPELEPLRAQCQTFISQRYKGKGKQLSADSQRKVFEAFASINEAVRVTYFPDEKTILEPPAQSDNTDSIVAEEFLHCFQELLQIIRTDGGDLLHEGEYSEIYSVLFSSSNELLSKHDEMKMVKTLGRDDLRCLVGE